MSSLHQDLLGKEQYLKMAETSWISGWYTVPIAGIMLLISTILIWSIKEK